MIYRTRIHQEVFGPRELAIETLANLDETIDALFAELEESGRTGDLEKLSPYFGTIWPSARALTAYLHGQDLRARGAMRVLEVGCGLAIPTLSLVNDLPLCLFHAMDFHPEVEHFLARNLRRNGIPPERVTYTREDWADPAIVTAQKFDLIIGSDVLYESKHPTELADALLKLAKRTGEIIITDPARPYLQNFQDEMRARGWLSDPIILTTKNFDGESTYEKDVFVLHFRSG